MDLTLNKTGLNQWDVHGFGLKSAQRVGRFYRWQLVPDLSRKIQT
jgi:hypothetical protein